MKKPCCRRFHGSLSRPNRRFHSLLVRIIGHLDLRRCSGLMRSTEAGKMEFETREEAKPYAASKGYEWEKDPFAPGC